MSPTRIQVGLDNPSQIQVWLEDHGHVLSRSFQALQQIVGRTAQQQFERRFDLDIRPEQSATRVLAAAGRQRVFHRILHMRSPFDIKGGMARLSLDLPYEVAPHQAVAILELLCDLAEAVESISRAPVDGIEPDPQRDLTRG